MIEGSNFRSVQSYLLAHRAVISNGWEKSLLFFAKGEALRIELALFITFGNHEPALSCPFISTRLYPHRGNGSSTSRNQIKNIRKRIITYAKNPNTEIRIALDVSQSSACLIATMKVKNNQIDVI